MPRIPAVHRGMGSRLAIAVTGLLPLSLVGAPAPSPSLNKLLLPAPRGYTVANVPFFHGHFTANALAANFASKASAARSELTKDGFVDGYGYVWINQATHRELIEYVIAFAGAQGAKSWLNFGKASDLADPAYKRADTTTGIGTYFGEHYVYPSHDVGDYFGFVKGNDLFGVGFTSRKDDVLALARTQAKKQYDAAPDFTIPPKDWPENAPHPAAPHAASAIMTMQQIAIVLGAILMFVVGAIVFLLIRSRRPRVIPGRVASQSTASDVRPPGG